MTAAVHPGNDEAAIFQCSNRLLRPYILLATGVAINLELLTDYIPNWIIELPVDTITRAVLIIRLPGHHVTALPKRCHGLITLPI